MFVLWIKGVPKLPQGILFFLTHDLPVSSILFLFFILWLHLGHMEVPRQGTESEPQLRPTLQWRQCQIL